MVYRTFLMIHKATLLHIVKNNSIFYKYLLFTVKILLKIVPVSKCTIYYKEKCTIKEHQYTIFLCAVK